jgi:hypothetical protein
MACGEGKETMKSDFCAVHRDGSKVRLTFFEISIAISKTADTLQEYAFRISGWWKIYSDYNKYPETNTGAWLSWTRDDFILKFMEMQVRVSSVWIHNMEVGDCRHSSIVSFVPIPRTGLHTVRHHNKIVVYMATSLLGTGMSSSNSKFLKIPSYSFLLAFFQTSWWRSQNNKR